MWHIHLPVWHIHQLVWHIHLLAWHIHLLVWHTHLLAWHIHNYRIYLCDTYINLCVTYINLCDTYIYLRDTYIYLCDTSTIITSITCVIDPGLGSVAKKTIIKLSDKHKYKCNAIQQQHPQSCIGSTNYLIFCLVKCDGNLVRMDHFLFTLQIIWKQMVCKGNQVEGGVTRFNHPRGRDPRSPLPPLTSPLPHPLPS